MNKKISAIIVLAMLVLSMQVFTIAAVQVTDPPILDWFPKTATAEQAAGQDVHMSLKRDPEWLKVKTDTIISHSVWIHVLGKDAYGQDVDAKCFIEEGTYPEQIFNLIDEYSGDPVTFSEITAVYQQDGEVCNRFLIETRPEPQQDYLGWYHKGVGYEFILDAEDYPIEPSNPDPLKVVAGQWNDNGDGIPEEDEVAPGGDGSTIIIKGLDQYGDTLEVEVTIDTSNWFTEVETPDDDGDGFPDYTWSTVCDVWGGAQGVSYFIFTHPKEQRCMLMYKIAVDHIEVTADPKNILADGVDTSEITITLLDKDEHEVHWTDLADPVEINVMATGGEVKPSAGIEIPECNTHAHTTLTSDTNARIVKVSALAIFPEVLDADDQVLHEADQLQDYDEVCFDGINSVPYKSDHETVCIGGTGSGTIYAVFKRLNEGCNLISIPVIPDEDLNWDELPGADQYLISVATYHSGKDDDADGFIDEDPVNGFDDDFDGLIDEDPVMSWWYYDFIGTVGDIIPIRDGWGYWVKAEKSCTLVISGRHMDQYDDITGFGFPPMYPMDIGWNLVGVTTTKSGMMTAEYLESLKDMGLGEKHWGPLWVYRNNKWKRNPPWLQSTEGFWLFTYDGILAP